MPMSRRVTLVTVAAVIAAAGAFSGLAATHLGSAPDTSSARSASPHPTAGTATKTAPYTAPSARAIAALPEARYDAVIAGLLPDHTPTLTENTVYRITHNTPLYGADKATPIARLDAKNFLGQDTVIIATTTRGPWTRILTPARQALPSQSPDAPAQTAAWIRTSQLIRVQTLAESIVVSLSQQSIRITNTDGTTVSTFPAGIGAPDTPTPTGVTGYLQARYLDPKQDQTIYPIGLTSLHSAAANEPYGGHDGGLIGIHYNPTNTGTISHGCIRLNSTAIKTINQLPLGTPISIQP